MSISYPYLSGQDLDQKAKIHSGYIDLKRIKSKESGESKFFDDTHKLFRVHVFTFGFLLVRLSF